VHDTVKMGGQLTEDTFDWYAQDAEGNLWYLGEDTTTYEKGNAKTKEGSWKAGVHGALPGIIVPAHPRIGLTYREEYYNGYAEDGAQIGNLNSLARVPSGRYDHLLQTRNFSSIEPGVIERSSTPEASGSCWRSPCLAARTGRSSSASSRGERTRRCMRRRLTTLRAALGARERDQSHVAVPASLGSLCATGGA
jgi:hypothetical protein